MINLSSELVETPKQHLVGHKQTLFIPHKEVAQIVVIIATTMKSKRRFSRAAGNPVSYLRMKSIKKMVQELVLLLSQNPQAKFMGFADDDMAARTVEELEQFHKLYKEHIGLPFFCALSPQQLKGAKGRKK